MKNKEAIRVIAIILGVGILTAGFLTILAFTRDAIDKTIPKQKISAVWLSDCNADLYYIGHKINQSKIESIFGTKGAEFQLRFDKPCKDESKQIVYLSAFADKKSESPLGYVVIGHAQGGYHNKDIDVLVALDNNKKIIAAEILKIQDDAPFLDIVNKYGLVEKFSGRTRESAQDPAFNASGATRSSNGIKKSVEQAFKQLDEWIDKSHPVKGEEIVESESCQIEDEKVPVKDSGSSETEVTKKPEDENKTDGTNPEDNKTDENKFVVSDDDEYVAEGKEYEIRGQKITLAKVKAVLPYEDIKFLIKNITKKGVKEIYYLEARDLKEEVVGYVTVGLTTGGFHNKDIYVLAGIDTEKKITGTELLKIEDDGMFVDAIVNSGFLGKFKGLTKKELMEPSLNVSRATYSSKGIKAAVENVFYHLTNYGVIKKEQGEKEPEPKVIDSPERKLPEEEPEKVEPEEKPEAEEPEEAEPEEKPEAEEPEEAEPEEKPEAEEPEEAEPEEKPEAEEPEEAEPEEKPEAEEPEEAEPEEKPEAEEPEEAEPEEKPEAEEPEEAEPEEKPEAEEPEEAEPEEKPEAEEPEEAEPEEKPEAKENDSDLPLVEDGKKYECHGKEITLGMLKSVLPEAADKIYVLCEDKKGKDIKGFVAKDKDGKTIGYAVIGAKIGGYYNREVVSLVGAKSGDKSTVSGVLILQIVDDNSFVRMVINGGLLERMKGRSVSEMTYDQSEKNPIRTVSRATYSSRGMVDSVQQALKNLAAITGEKYEEKKVEPEKHDDDEDYE